ncbi:hypothetical protein AB0C10_11605 [Microbispora amethystogenes]|uniref:hypothetical protein n=1 Tax=Microbispora amethystogenes TaxID=1427754 RepID=UPI00340F60DE
MGTDIALSPDCLDGRPCLFSLRDYEHSAVAVESTPIRAGTLEIPNLRAGFAALVATEPMSSADPGPGARLR